MRFVDAWIHLPPLHLLLLLAPGGVLIGTLLVPGRSVARGASIALAIIVLALPGFGPLALRVGWSVLWLAVAHLAGRSREPEWRGDTPRPGGIESSAIGVALAAALLALLVAALVRQDLPAAASRPAALGELFVVAGIAHLMLRRDAMRGAMSFAAIGMGLQWLERAARAAVIEARDWPEGGVLLAAAASVTLAARAAAARQRDAGSAWVSHAHDLHD